MESRCIIGLASLLSRKGAHLSRSYATVVIGALIPPNKRAAKTRVYEPRRA